MNLSTFAKLKPIEWLLFALLVLAPVYFHYNIGGTGFRIPNNIVVWFIACVIGFYSLYKFTLAKHFYIPRYFLLLITFPILAFFSGISAGVEIANTWIFRLLFIWGGLLFFFGLYQHQLKQGRIDRILFLIVLSGLVHASVGLAQITLVTDVPSWLPINRSGIPTGLFQQINNQASFQTTSLITALWLATRPFIRRGKPWLFWLLLVAIACSAFVLSYSGSRVGMLALVLALPLFLASRWHKIKLEKKRWLLISAVIFTSLSSASLFESNRGLATVMEKTAAINAGFSGSSRLGIYTIAYDAFKEQPIFGHGIGSFIRVWQLGKADFYIEHPNATLPNQRVAHPHNETILWLMEGGVIAGLGLILVLLAVLLTLKNLPPSRRYVYTALLIPIALHTQVELPFYISASHWFVFLILLFAVMHPCQRQRTIILSNAAKKSIQMFTVAAGLATTVFLTHTMASTFEFKDYLLKKASRENPFPLAMKNPYFKQLAMETTLTSLFFSSMKYGVDDNVRSFLKWSEQELKTNPHILYYKLSVEGHAYLKNNQHACNLTREGLSLYPNDPKLNKVLGKCEELNF